MSKQEPACSDLGRPLLSRYGAKGSSSNLTGALPLNPTIEITSHEISALLEETVIDHVVQNDEAIYVTGLAFNFWIKIEAERSLITRPIGSSGRK